MKQRAAGPIHPIMASYPLAALVGCAPTVNVAGVYFPGWLVSAVVGIVISYGIVLSLGRRASTRGLADSGLLFVSLAASVALATWCVLFSGF